VIAIAAGVMPTGIGSPTTMLVAVSMTERLASKLLVT
jgi:hypothetical protein